jgi:hypothetical protein
MVDARRAGGPHLQVARTLTHSGSARACNVFRYSGLRIHKGKVKVHGAQQPATADIEAGAGAGSPAPTLPKEAASLERPFDAKGTQHDK